MNQVLLPVQPGHYPQELLDFIANLHPISRLQLTAAFIPMTDYAHFAASADGKTLYTDDGEGRARTIRYQSETLTRFCAESGIQSRVHVDDREFAQPSLIAESRFADWILLSSQHFFDHIRTQPNIFMRDMLHRAECPVLLLPRRDAFPGEIVLAYDGSEQSLYAIRQFSYLFPAFKGIETTLVYISGDLTENLPDEAPMLEWGLLHFDKFHIERLHAKDKAVFFTSWIKARNHPWVVTGSYGRAAISEIFSASFSEALIRDARIPLFIAHR